MMVEINDKTAKLLDVICRVYHVWAEDELDFSEMIALMTEEVYANMWKDVNKERYDDYKGK